MAKKAKKTTSRNCRPSYTVSQAGHLLKVKSSSRAGKTLATNGKKEKNARRQRGCLNGPPGTFKLTAKQKKKLPKALQKAILTYHRKKGKRIID